MAQQRVFKTRPFARWMRKTLLTDVVLCKAMDEMSRGLVDADLGGGVVKKRVALPGRGKSGSVRTLLATNKRDRWFFVFGFEKNERDNIDLNELRTVQETAKALLALKDKQIDAALGDGALLEICNDDEA